MSMILGLPWGPGPVDSVCCWGAPARPPLHSHGIPNVTDAWVSLTHPQKVTVVRGVLPLFKWIING